MNKTKIYFIDDLHGVKECYSWQISKLRKIKPQVVFLEMLPCEEYFKNLCSELSEGLVSVDEFKLKSDWENIWGTFEGYKDLFVYLQKKHISIYSMDYSLEERKRFVGLELEMIKKLKVKVNVKDLIDESSIILFLERETVFSRNILKYVRKNAIEKVVVIVGGNHIERLTSFFNFLRGFEAEAVRLPKDKFSKLYPKFRDLHLKYAKEKKILEMEFPPLVPINVLRYSLMNKK